MPSDATILMREESWVKGILERLRIRVLFEEKLKRIKMIKELTEHRNSCRRENRMILIRR
jgi:hypothetical protein